MRKVLLVGGAAALIALPAPALAGNKGLEPVPEVDPTAEDVAGAPTTTTDKALHAEGRGVFRYEGSGGVTIEGRGVVRVLDLSTGGDLKVTATGFETGTEPGPKPKPEPQPAPVQKTAAGWSGTQPGAAQYDGEGTLALDGSSYRVVMYGGFTADVDPTATNPVEGSAKVLGRGETILEGGIPVPFWASRRILLTTGPMAVDLEGRGGPEWWRSTPWTDQRVPKAKDALGRRAEQGRRAGERSFVATKRWWRWDRRTAGATWRLSGPASGAVDITAVTGRIRVWDRSTAKDLAVTVPTGTQTRTLGDGSVVYWGLDDAEVTVNGTGFRMKVRATEVEGTFTPTAGSLARSFVRGKGTFDAGPATDLWPGRHGGVRVLLQPATAPPATEPPPKPVTDPLPPTPPAA